MATKTEEMELKCPREQESFEEKINHVVKLVNAQQFSQAIALLNSIDDAEFSQQDNVLACLFCSQSFEKKCA